jgi:hypothetical protein
MNKTPDQIHPSNCCGSKQREPQLKFSYFMIVQVINPASLFATLPNVLEPRRNHVSIVFPA